MSSEQEFSGGQEFGRRPKFIVHFEGLYHAPFNLHQGMDLVRKSLLDVAGSTDGKTTVFLEMVGLTRSAAETYKKLSERYGLVGSIIAALHILKAGSAPSVDFVTRRIEQIDQEGIGEALERGWLSTDITYQYKLWQLIENLSNDLKLDVVYETHSLRVAKISMKFFEESNLAAKKSFDAWNKRDFYASIEARRDFFRKHKDANDQREAEIIEQVKSLTRKLQKEKEGGAVFIAMGHMHNVLLPMIEKKVDPQRSLFAFTSSINSGEPFSPEIDDFVRRGKDIPDLSVARLVLASMIISDVIESARANGQIREIINEFMDLVVETNGVVSQLSLDKIKTICESGQSPLGVISKI